MNSVDDSFARFNIEASATFTPSPRKLIGKLSESVLDIGCATDSSAVSPSMIHYAEAVSRRSRRLRIVSPNHIPNNTNRAVAARIIARLPESVTFLETT